MEMHEIAATTVAVLAPYLPTLVKTGKLVAKSAIEGFAKKGGEAGWKKAEAIWGRLQQCFGGNPALENAVALVASQPEELAFKTALAKAVDTSLRADPKLAESLVGLLGGPEAIQEVFADSASQIRNIVQMLTGAGKQTVKAKNKSVIEGVTMKKTE